MATTVSTMDVLVVDHPLVKSRLSTMRDARTDNATFRAALRDLTLMLVYEATARRAPLRTAPDPHARRAHPVLQPGRARRCWCRCCGPGWAWWTRRRRSSPSRRSGSSGMARDEETHQAVTYMVSLPESLAGRPVFVLDPMLATGGSMVHTIELLAERGAADVTAVCALAAPEGIARLRDSGLSVRLVTASVDERLNDSAYIVPGLGDAGDRQFGSV